jgi:hypothetical protein
MRRRYVVWLLAGLACTQVGRRAVVLAFLFFGGLVRLAVLVVAGVWVILGGEL